MGGCMSSESDKTAAGLSRENSMAMAENDAAEAAAMLGGSNLSMAVELSIRCEGMRNSDTFSKSDPFCVVSMRPPNGQWTEVGRTEVIANTTTPAFVKRIKCTYRFEEVQEVKFDFYDCDSSFKSTDTSGIRLNSQDTLGSATTTMAGIFGARGTRWMGSISRGGRVIVTGEELSHNGMEVCFTVRGEKFENKDTFSKSDPFLIFSKMREDGTFTPVLKTEVKKDNLSPTFAPIRGAVARIAGGDMSCPLKIQAFDYDKSGSHELIGECRVSLQDIENMARQGPPAHCVLVNEEKKRRKGSSYHDSGKLYFENFTTQMRPTFLEYVRGGMELCFITAVDFTGSNGDPGSPSSLHFVNGHTPNQYEQAIMAVGPVLEHYDSHRMYPVFGFGGARGGRTSHCFALSGDDSNPCVSGVQGILNVYKQSLRNTQLSGPTLFRDIIARAAATAASTPQSAGHQRYYVLLIITDGEINDMENTIEQVVAASALPLSILIIGVGNADFSGMERLDGDKQKLRGGSGRVATRDIVQFVPMRQFLGKPGVSDLVAKELLAEIPSQCTSFYKSINLPPNAPVVAPPPPPYEG